MAAIRTFIAVALDESIRDRASRVIVGLRRLAPNVKWVAPHTLHITLRFLGNVEESDIPDICDKLREAAGKAKPFSIGLSGLGVFPNPKKPRVVWLGVSKGSKELERLASVVDAKMAEAGFAGDERGFKSHITLGRANPGSVPANFHAGIGDIKAENIGIQQVNKIILMKSVLTPRGPVYSPLDVFDLGI